MAPNLFDANYTPNKRKVSVHEEDKFLAFVKEKLLEFYPPSKPTTSQLSPTPIPPSPNKAFTEKTSHSTSHGPPLSFSTVNFSEQSTDPYGETLPFANDISNGMGFNETLENRSNNFQNNSESRWNKFVKPRGNNLYEGGNGNVLGGITSGGAISNSASEFLKNKSYNINNKRTDEYTNNANNNIFESSRQGNFQDNFSNFNNERSGATNNFSKVPNEINPNFTVDSLNDEQYNQFGPPTNQMNFISDPPNQEQNLVPDSIATDAIMNGSFQQERLDVSLENGNEFKTPQKQKTVNLGNEDEDTELCVDSVVKNGKKRNREDKDFIVEENSSTKISKSKKSKKMEKEEFPEERKCPTFFEEDCEFLSLKINIEHELKKMKGLLDYRLDLPEYRPQTMPTPSNFPSTNKAESFVIPSLEEVQVIGRADGVNGAFLVLVQHSVYLLNPYRANEAIFFSKLFEKYNFRLRPADPHIQIIKRDFSDEKCWEIVTSQSLHHLASFKINGFSLTQSLNPDTGTPVVFIDHITPEIEDYGKEDFIELVQKIVDSQGFEEQEQKIQRPGKVIEFLTKKAKENTEKLPEVLKKSQVCDIVKQLFYTSTYLALDGSPLAKKIFDI